MRLRGLDLNLLVAFDMLLTERNVTSAARKLNLSQSAASSALGRLRQFFNDDILVAHGRRMYITPYANSLWPQVQECLLVAEGLIVTSSAFDAGTSRRVFRIVASDYITTAICAPLMRVLAKTAPGIAFEFILPDQAAIAQLEDGVIDLLIAPSDYIADDQPAEVLLEERYVVAGWSQNPAFDTMLDEAAFLECGHIAVLVGPTREQSHADRQLALLRKPRRVELISRSFAQLPWLLVQTDRLSVMPERLAIVLAQTFAIAHAPLPFDFPPLQEMMQYHQSRVRDEGLSWLCGELRGFVANPT